MIQRIDDMIARFPKLSQYLAPGLAIILYAHTFQWGFVLDDQAVIVQNRFIHAGFAGIPKLLTTWYWEGYWHQNAGLYRPLSLITFAIEWAISPDNPLLHHVVQVALYAITAVQVHRLTTRLANNRDHIAPLLVAMLFVAHPIHTEVVANIKSRDELLCFLFFTLGANEALRSQKATWLGCLYFMGALLSKESGLFYLPMLFLLFDQFCGLHRKAALKAIAPYVILSAAWLAWATFVIWSAADPRVPYTYRDNSLLACPGTVSRVFTGLEIMGRYLLKGFYPYQMSYDYSFNEIPCAGTFSLLGIVVLAICTFLIYFAIRRLKTDPIVAWGILFFFSTLLPTSNILFPIGATMADRFLYTPVFGLILATVYGLRSLLRGRVSLLAGGAASLAVLACFGSMTRTRAAAWSSNLKLFRTDADESPHSARTQFNYAAVLLAQASTDSSERRRTLTEAGARSRTALDIDPAYEDAWVNLGAAQDQLGLYADAAGSFKAALRLAPGDSTVYLELADAYVKGERFDSACALYAWSLKQGLHRANTFNYYGKALFALSRYEEAISVYRTGLAQTPANAELWRNYGSALATRRQFNDAITAFRKANELSPDDPQTWYYLAITYQQLGNDAMAKSFMDKLNRK